MPQEVISGIRSTSEGLNYKAVKDSMDRAKPAGQGQFRTIESVRREQTRRKHGSDMVRVRRRHSTPEQEGAFRITKKGVFYAVVTVAMVVMVKLMITFASKSGLPSEPPKYEVRPMSG